MGRTLFALLVAALGAATTGHVFAQEVLSKTEIIRSLAPMAAGVNVTQSVDLDIRFEVNSADLSVGAVRQLDELGDALLSHELTTVIFLIAGHTDATGPAVDNKALSLRRATAVQRYLMERHGIAAHRLSVIGWGEERLKRPFDPAAAVNRRVEISVRLPGLPEKEPLDGIIRR